MLELRVANGDLLRRAVAPLIEIDDDKGIVKYSPNGVSLSTAWDEEVFIYAILIIKPFNSDNNPFRCNHSRFAGIDLNEVYNKLIFQYEESSIAICADDGEEGFNFVFRIAGQCNLAHFLQESSVISILFFIYLMVSSSERVFLSYDLISRIIHVYYFHSLQFFN